MKLLLLYLPYIIHLVGVNFKALGVDNSSNSGKIAFMSVVFKRTKILATIGPATNSYELVEKMIQAGVNGFRLNFSHGTYEERDQQIAWVREASKN